MRVMTCAFLTAATFCPTGTTLHNTRVQTSLNNRHDHVRVGRARRATPANAQRRHVPTAQLMGSIEDMPAERIPDDIQSIPQHWRRPGVYGVYSQNDVLQYVAAVRDVGAAIAEHVRFVPSAADRFAVRMLTVDHVDDAPLSAIAESWVMTHTSAADIPPGNGDDAPEWRRERVLGDVYFTPGVIAEFASSEIKAIVRQHPVALFMKGVRAEPRCGFSAAVVDILRANLGDEFVCVDCLSERNQGLREGIKQFSKWPTIPQLYVDGDFVGGADIIQAMHQSGELRTLLSNAVNRAAQTASP